MPRVRRQPTKTEREPIVSESWDDDESELNLDDDADLDLDDDLDLDAWDDDPGDDD